MKILQEILILVFKIRIYRISLIETKNGVNKMYYVSTNHLGSINCVCKKPPTSSLLSQRISVIYSSKLTKFVVSKASNLPISYQTQNVLQNNKNSNGNVVDDLSYDVCSVKLGFCEQSETKAIVELIPSSEANREGRNRNPIDWTYSNITLSSITDRGYTSHEQLTNFGLINMNGRVYDPMTLGFLSPDPFVQNPTNSQNYNRFSYVLNNPLKYVDPSGYMVWDPWFETMINGNRFFKEFPEMFENFRDKNGNLWKLRDDMKFSDENGNVFLRKIDEGLYVEIAKYQEIQEKLRQYNSLFRDANIGFIAGAGTLRVEGEMGRGITVPYIIDGMENTAQAVNHYFNGRGTPVTLGNNTINALILSNDFQTKHKKIISGKTTSLTGNFSINLTNSVFHIGKTNVDYSIHSANGYSIVTYDLFVRDGFWDPDYIDELFLGKLFGISHFQPDGPGPNLEIFGGTPYRYNTVKAKYKFQNPGY